MSVDERPPSQFPPDFSRVTEPILRTFERGAMTYGELRANLRKAGMVLDPDDSVIDPQPPDLPPLAGDDDYEDEEAA